MCVASQASVREGPGLSVWAPPLQLPYFIRGHQLNSCSTVRVRLQFFSFSLLPSLSLWQTVPQAHSRPSSSYDFSLCQLTSVFCFSPNSPMPSRSLPSLPPIRPFSRLPLFSVQFLSLNQCCLVFQNKLTLMIFQHIVKTSFPCVDWSL